jgi:hypothetical protein
MRRYICPQCQQKTGVKLVYGYPGDEMREQAERGEIALGGCCQPWGSPDRQCVACGHEWEIVRRVSPSGPNGGQHA